MLNNFRSINDSILNEKELKLEERLAEELEERIEFACWVDCSCNGDQSN